MKKRIAAIFTALMLICTNAYAAPPGVTVVIPPKDNLSDEKYVITVAIAENPGFAAAQIELAYDKDVIECQQIIPGEVLKEMLTDTNPKATGEKQSAILSAAGTENISVSGNIASFVFDKPKDGNPAFEFTQLELTALDGTRLDLDINIQNDYGDISSGEEKTPDSNTTNKPGGSSSGGGGKHNLGGGQITIQPSGDVKPAEDIKPTEDAKPTEDIKPAKTFTDVDDTHWAKAYIDKAVEIGIVSGYENGAFLPDKEMSRAEFATIVWNMAGKPANEEKINLNDVTSDDWFYTQIVWAYKNGYISGTSENEFSPNANITREQAMTILWRYKGSPNAENAADKFSDCNEISDYAKPAMNWATANNIISGTSETKLAPKANATRAQLAAIIVRILNK